MFTQAPIILSTRGWGCMAGEGGMCGRGECMTGDMHGRGVCVVGGHV